MKFKKCSICENKVLDFEIGKWFSNDYCCNNCFDIGKRLEKIKELKDEIKNVVDNRLDNIFEYDYEEFSSMIPYIYNSINTNFESIIGHISRIDNLYEKIEREKGEEN